MVVFLAFLSLFSLFTQHSFSTPTIIVDGVTKWSSPIVHVGDSIMFEHKYNNYNLYIFKNQNAFNHCDFTHATLLTKSNASSYIWQPSTPGFYYFTFTKNNSITSCNQLESSSQRLSIKVLPTNTASRPTTTSPSQPPIPAPITGGVIPSSPSYPWPFQPREVATSPMQAPIMTSPSTGRLGGNSIDAMPSSTDNVEGGNSMPFIDSNPAVPLPTDEIDSTSIRPLPTSGTVRHLHLELLGLFWIHMALIYVVNVMML